MGCKAVSNFELMGGLETQDVTGIRARLIPGNTATPQHRNTATPQHRNTATSLPSNRLQKIPHLDGILDAGFVFDPAANVDPKRFHDLDNLGDIVGG